MSTAVVRDQVGRRHSGDVPVSAFSSISLVQERGREDMALPSTEPNLLCFLLGTTNRLIRAEPTQDVDQGNLQVLPVREGPATVWDRAQTPEEQHEADRQVRRLRTLGLHCMCGRHSAAPVCVIHQRPLRRRWQRTGLRCLTRTNHMCCSLQTTKWSLSHSLRR